MGAAPLVLNGIPMRVLAHPMMTFSCDDINERSLVIIQMHGGNDGINTFIPVDQYSDYINLRPSIGLADSGSRAYIELDSTLPLASRIGIQPEMSAFKDLYDDGLAHVVMGVNYDNNNKSHFKGGNIWLTGGDSTTNGQDLKSGWFGRYLDYSYPNYPTAYPNAGMLDPIGLEFGSKTISLGYHRTSGVPIGLALSNDPTDFYSMVSGIGGAFPGNIPLNRHGSEMQYLMDVQQSTNFYGSRLNDLYNQGMNSPGISYPEHYHTSGGPSYWNELAPQLRTVARLISGGCKTKVYLVRITGFDTHTSQVVNGDPSMGRHATLMWHLSEAVKAFMTDLQAQGLEDKVMMVTFSEFGRQVGENGNYGCDHGTLAPMMLFGRGIKPGVSGINPDYSSLHNNNFTSFQYDYRQVFTTLLQDWLGASSTALAQTQFSTFESQKLDLVNDAYDDGSGSPTDYVAPTGCDSLSFPVGLQYFKGEVENDVVVRLTWGTASETNNSHFDIERSIDGSLFEPLIRVPGAGTTMQDQSYSALDEKPLPGVSYYRLKQTDLDGTYSYQGVVEIYLDESLEVKAHVRVFPNPASTQLMISIQLNEGMPAEMSLLNATGQKVLHKRLNLKQGVNQHQLDVSAYPPGIYFAFVKPIGNYAGLGKAKVLIQR